MGEEMKEWANMWGAKVGFYFCILYSISLFFSSAFLANIPASSVSENTLFQVKLRNDMPDDMLRDAIETSRRVLDSYDFETQGFICELICRQTFFSFTLYVFRFGVR